MRVRIKSEYEQAPARSPVVLHRSCLYGSHSGSYLSDKDGNHTQHSNTPGLTGFYRYGE